MLPFHVRVFCNRGLVCLVRDNKREGKHAPSCTAHRPNPNRRLFDAWRTCSWSETTSWRPRRRWTAASEVRMDVMPNGGDVQSGRKAATSESWAGDDGPGRFGDLAVTAGRGVHALCSRRSRARVRGESRAALEFQVPDDAPSSRRAGGLPHAPLVLETPGGDLFLAPCAGSGCAWPDRGRVSGCAELEEAAPGAVRDGVHRPAHHPPAWCWSNGEGAPKTAGRRAALKGSDIIQGRRLGGPRPDAGLQTAGLCLSWSSRRRHCRWGPACWGSAERPSSHVGGSPMGES